MKKDIKITPVKNVYLALTQEVNETFKTLDTYVYLINQKNVELNMVLIVSSGRDKHRITSKMHHKIESLPAQSAAKIELIQEEVLALDNHFKVTFFEGNQLFEKDFILPGNSLKQGQLRHLKYLNKRGILIK